MDKELKENLERFFIFPFRKHPFRTIVFIIFIMSFRIISFSPDFSRTWDIFVVSFISIFGMVFLYPIMAEMIFYTQYKVTQHNLSALRFSIENDKKNFASNFHEFIKDYNLFRNQLKESVRKPKLNIITHNQETRCLIQKIDVFFDATVKLIIKNKDSLTCSHLNEIENIFDPLGNSLFSSPTSINTLHIQELFNKFNKDIKNLDVKLFEDTRKNVEEYYGERRLIYITSFISFTLSNTSFQISILLITVIINKYTDIIEFLTTTVYNYLL